MKARTPSEETITILNASGMLQAIVIKEHLERSGIPVFLDYGTEGHPSGSKLNTSDEISIKVAREYVKEVKTLLGTIPPSGEIFSIPGNAVH